MNKDLEIIFRDMEAEGLIERFRGIRPVKKFEHIKFITPDVEKIFIDKPEARFILKKSSSSNGLLSVASSKMYKSADIQTPQVHLVRSKEKNVIRTIQEDISDINGFETVLAGDDVEYTKIGWNVFGKFKWQIFYDYAFQSNLLKIMTNDCLEQLQNMFLGDEIRTDIDRHSKNYFLYKRKGSEKYEGVIVIDLDQMIIFNYCRGEKGDFQDFLMYPYETEIPQFKLDNICYKQRVKDIQEMIQEGLLSENNIETLKKLLMYDFPGEVKKVCKEQGVRRKMKKGVVDPVERLWEYNNKTIGKELGL